MEIRPESSLIGRPVRDRPLEGAIVGAIVRGDRVIFPRGDDALLAGDSAGTVNPFNGEGIDYAYETGRMAAEVISEAIRLNDPALLSRYPAMLDAEYGRYFKVARLFAKVIGRPATVSKKGGREEAD